MENPATHSTSSGTRRAALLALAAGLIGALALVVPGSASALGVWCSGDPLILVNGNVVDVTVHVPLDRLRSVQRVDIVYHVPSNSTSVVLNDSLLFPATVQIVKDQPRLPVGVSSFKVLVDIKVHHSGAAFPIGATVLAQNGGSLWISGTSDMPMRVTTWTRLGLHTGVLGL